MNNHSLAILLSALVLTGSLHRAYSEPATPAKQENVKNRWPTVKRLVESRDYTAAAKTAVEELEGDYRDRQYAMWKWWETMFGERKDYQELSQKFGDSLFDLYEHSPAPRRRVIAAIFGRPDFEVSKSARDLRAELEKKTAAEPIPKP